MSDSIPRPPDPPQVAHTVSAPGGDRADEYYWMRDDTRSRQDVIERIELENEYSDAVLAHTKELRETLYRELVARIRPDDDSVPVRERGWWYGMRFREGSEYPTFYRRRDPSDEDSEQILLDGDVQAQGHEYYDVGDLEVSPDDRLLVYTDDTVGRREYTVRFRDIATGEDLTDTISRCDPGVAWADDGTTLLYIEQDPETLLGVRVKSHRVGTDSSADSLVFENPDDAFYMGVRRSLSDEYLFIDLDSTDTSESFFARAGSPKPEFATVAGRIEGHEYDTDHLGEDFIIRTNLDAPNFRIVRVAVGEGTDVDRWESVLDHSEEVFVEGILPLRDYLICNIRRGGLLRLLVMPWGDGASYEVEADDASSTMYIGPNREQDTHTFRYGYTSPTTPMSDMSIDLRSRERTLLKRAYAGDDFDSSKYVADYLHITARDGTSIPVSTVRHVDTPLDGTAPSLQYGYGAYGLSTDPVFRASWLNLVNRGFVLVIAHIRGGQELGRAWYEAGRQQSKMNTFTDFIDVTQGLIDSGRVAADRVVAMGGSAGGLLMGAVVNMAPQLYRAIVAQVPFVDVVTTMLDPTIPLTTNEYDEWGNPADADAYRYMLQYSPYDNVSAQDYPAIFVLTGLHDSQVQYWEPLKWVARLRRVGTGSEPILLHTRMDAGHGGASGRYRALEDTALVQAFILDRTSVQSPRPPRPA